MKKRLMKKSNMQKISLEFNNKNIISVKEFNAWLSGVLCGIGKDNITSEHIEEILLMVSKINTEDTLISETTVSIPTIWIEPTYPQPRKPGMPPITYEHYGSYSTNGDINGS